MSVLGLARDEYLWRFSYAELILCYMAQGEMNGTTYNWNTFDMQIEVMTNLKKIREGEL
jgi:hypothetical protein